MTAHDVGQVRILAHEPSDEETADSAFPVLGGREIERKSSLPSSKSCRSSTMVSALCAAERKTSSGGGQTRHTSCKRQNDAERQTAMSFM